MIQRTFNVDVAFDETSRCYVVVESDLAGLHAESPDAFDIVAMILQRAEVILQEPVTVQTKMLTMSPRCIAN
jgi:hypothetical protein